MRIKFSLLFFLSFTHSAFSQNTLNDYLESAIKNSPVFTDNQNQMRSLEFDSMRLHAGYKPKVNFTSTDFYAPILNGYGYDEIITNGGNYNALLGVNYTLFGKNNLKNQYSSFYIERQILELNSKVSERDLKQLVSAQYITVFGEQQVLANVKNVLDVLKEEDLLLKSIAQKGIYRQTDYLSFFVSYKQQELAYSQQKLQAQNDFYLLNYLCGIVDTAYILLTDPSLSTSAGYSHEKTIQFHRFYLDSLKIQNSFEQLKFNYKPKLTLLGDAGYNTSFIYHAERNFGASVGLNFSVPIIDGGQRKLQGEKFKLAENTRLKQIDFFKNQYNMKQMQLLQQLTETEKLIEEAKGQFKISETLLKANNKLLEIGDLKIPEYVLSMVNYISLQSTMQQLITNKMQLINQYNYLNY
ncbi:MAG: TolC family protein [Bacteroidota bacterium]